MRTGICKLCLEHRELCDSHALPNSLFKYILRKQSGKAHLLTDDADTPRRQSSDTWDTELLCKDCEDSLNRRFDEYGMGVFRAKRCSVRVHEGGVDLLNVDSRRLRMFFLSILWRISISTHQSYSNIKLPKSSEDEMRHSLHVGRNIPSTRYTVVLYKMRDSTPNGGFSNEALRDFVMTPFARNYGECISVCYPFLSFFVETFLPRAPARYAKRIGVITGRSPIINVPKVELLEIPELRRLMTNALRKDLASQTGDD